MINADILNKFKPITDEERAIQNGTLKYDVDHSIYLDSSRSVIDAKKLLEEGKLITVRPHARFFHSREHTHNYIEVVYMCSGTTTHFIDGKKIILKAGELLFLSQSVRQEILPAGENDIAINFIILPQFFDRCLTMIGMAETPLHLFIVDALKGGNSSIGFLHFKISDVLPIQNLIENLIYTLINNTPNKRLINQTTMGLLFMQLLNHTEKIGYNTPADAATLQIFRYIEHNYKTATLTELAESLHYDVYALSREIKKATGKNFTELLLEKRLSQAEFLLRNSNMNVDNISRAVGYENISYFHRKFKEKYGMSPMHFRNCK